MSAGVCNILEDSVSKMVQINTQFYPLVFFFSVGIQWQNKFEALIPSMYRDFFLGIWENSYFKAYPLLFWVINVVEQLFSNTAQ